VAWITERRDVLSGFFVMLAVLAWLRAVERAPRPHHGWWALSLLAFAASLLSKAQALPLPAALLLLDAYPLGRVRRLGWRQVLVEKVPHGALAVAAAVVSLLALRAGGVEVTPWAEYGPAARVAMVGYSLVFYPAKWLWPADLSPLYELPPRLDPLEPRFLLALAAAALVTAVLVALRRRWPGGLAAWTYSALMLLPVSGVVHAGHQLAHDRYSYLSGLGFALLAGAGFLWVLRAAARGSLRPAMASLALGTAALVLVGWAGAAWRQSHVWRDSETLWRWAQAVDPDCVVCNVNLGEVIMRSPGLTLERARAAEGYFRHATRVDPRRASAHHNLASTLIAQGRLADAVSPLAEVVRLEPRAPEPLARLGLLYVELGREAEAIPVLRQALELSPGLDGVRGALGRALTRRAEALEREGRGAEAAALRREAGTLSTGG
jgi:tetratricopeptide (TPR) repeat protein